MRAFQLLLLSLAVVLMSAVRADSDVGQLKLEKMRKLRDASSDGIIELTPLQYEELVMANPRPYNLVSVYTVTTGCEECDALYGELTGAAYSYSEAEKDLKVPTFFCKIIYSTNKDIKLIFYKHDFKMIPYLATSLMQLRREGDFYKPEDLWKVKRDDTFETQQLLDFFNKRFNEDVQIKFPLWVVFTKNATLFFTLVVLIRVFVHIQDFLVNQLLWITIAWVGYFICTSGVIYTILNNVPMFKMEQDQYGGQYVAEYFMRSSRGQYGAEGYITSALALFVSASFLLLAKADVLVETAGKRRVLCAIGIVGAGLGIYSYIYCYKLKTPWYSNSFMPPEGYMKGPIMRDQGNNI